jgi:predicted amidophosphoribosyltransferase
MIIQFLYPLCLRCGSLSVRSSLFCRYCEIEFLYPRIVLHRRLIKNECVDFLMHWVPNESDSLSELVYLLKSRLSFSVWKYYVEKFKNLHAPMREMKTAIIPVPGSRIGKVAYHTRYFALAWQLLSAGDIVNCLVSSSEQGEQKDLTLAERGRATMCFLEDFTTVIGEYERVILIDDIVTSGNTLQASLMAIKPHLRSDCLVEIKALLSRGKI